MRYALPSCTSSNDCPVHCFKRRSRFQIIDSVETLNAVSFHFSNKLHLIPLMIERYSVMFSLCNEGLGGDSCKLTLKIEEAYKYLDK